MSSIKTLEDFAKVIGECVKCGICQAHCPTYQQTRREGAVARGKIALAAALLGGEAGLEKRLREDIGMCLMCGSCENKCPNKMPTNEIVGAIRRRITDNRGLSPLGKGVSNPARLDNPAEDPRQGRGAAFAAPFEKGAGDQRSAPALSGRRRWPTGPCRRSPFATSLTGCRSFTQGRQDMPVVGFFAGCIDHLCLS